MINSGRSEELFQAHNRLYETLKSGRLDNVREIVRESYFGELVYGDGE